MYLYIIPFLSFPLTSPSQSSRSSQSTELSFCTIQKLPISIYLTHGGVYMSMLLSIYMLMFLKISLSCNFLTCFNLGKLPSEPVHNHSLSSDRHFHHCPKYFLSSFPVLIFCFLYHVLLIYFSGAYFPIIF